MAATSPARHLLIPFASRSSPACREAQATLQLPHLDALLAQLSTQSTDSRADTDLTPPHERAMARSLGLSAADGCLPWAALEARRLGLDGSKDNAGWGAITLCHWQIDIDDMVLGDPAALGITAAESASLLTAAKHLFEDDDIALHPSATPGRWLAQSRLFDALPTASVDRAVNQPMSTWWAPTAGNRPLRRLQNEMQMLLYTQRVNDDRVAHGLLSINSFWVSGTGALPAGFTEPSTPQPLVADVLRTAALADDGAAWAAAWKAFDRDELPAWVAQCKAGADIALTLCGDTGSQTWVRAPRSLMHRITSIFSRERLSAVLSSL